MKKPKLKVWLKNVDREDDYLCVARLSAWQGYLTWGDVEGWSKKLVVIGTRR